MAYRHYFGRYTRSILHFKPTITPNMQRGILLGIVLLIVAIVSGLILTIIANRKLVKVKSTPKRLLPEILSNMKLKPDELLYELGAGDFRVLIEAWKMSRVKGVGYEISPILAIVAKLRKLVKAGPMAKITIHVDDFLRADIKNSDKIFCHLNKLALFALIEKFEKELSEDTLIFSYDHTIPNIPHKETYELSDGTRLYQYDRSSFTAPK